MSVSDGLIVWKDVLRVAKLEANKSKLDPIGLENFTTEDQDWFIQQSYDVVVLENWNLPYAYYGRVYYAAYAAFMSITPGAGEGAVTSESIGNVSIGRNQSTNNPSADEADRENHFGRQYFLWKEKALANLPRVFVGMGC